jgi:D-glycero-alpha-D-manno-heptose-7-phosphate kinase
VIITKTPFRVSFGGGGSDLPSFYRQNGGCVLSVTISKYVYISMHPYFNSSQFLLKYSKTELAGEVADIQHRIFREVLAELWPAGGVEITSTADIPSGTGLGSSSSFAVGLLHAVYAYRAQFRAKEQLAEEACRLEIEALHEPIGKQDQYAAAYGGLNLFEFKPDDSVVRTPVILPADALLELENSLMLFYTGDQRETGEILRDQIAQVAGQPSAREAQEGLVKIAYDMCQELNRGRLDGFGRLLHRGWLLKRSLSSKISNPRIDSFYQRALESGALGGKLLGAGGGGFLLLYCPLARQELLRRALADLYELPFRFDWGGSQVIFVEPDATRGSVHRRHKPFQAADSQQPLPLQ